MTYSAGSPIVLDATNGPKDVTSESIDLSDRVKMWMRTSLMPLSRPERDEDYAKSRGDPFGRSGPGIRLVGRAGKYWGRSNETERVTSEVKTSKNRREVPRGLEGTHFG